VGASIAIFVAFNKQSTRIFFGSGDVGHYWLFSRRNHYIRIQIAN
jgi:hypothetical protein